MQQQDRGVFYSSNNNSNQSIDLNLYKVSLDQKSLCLIDSLLMELSLIGSPSNQTTASSSLANRTNQMEGILKVLEWRANENITDPEFESLYNEWLKSKEFFLESHLSSYEYDQLIPKNTLIAYLRKCTFPDLTSTIEASEAYYMMLDDQGIGIVGLDSIMFLFMGFIRISKVQSPTSRIQFETQFSKFIERIPHSNGYFSLRSIKIFLCNNLNEEEMKEIVQVSNEMIYELGWNNQDSYSSGEQEAFPKIFYDSFIENMHLLHQSKVIRDEDLLRDELLNVYNILLSEEYFSISAACNQRVYALKVMDPGRLYRALHSRCIAGEFYPRATLEALQVQPLAAVFSGFVVKFQEKIEMYITSFLNKYTRHSSSSQSTQNSENTTTMTSASATGSASHLFLQPQKSHSTSNTFKNNASSTSTTMSYKTQQQRGEYEVKNSFGDKENYYQPKINLFENEPPQQMENSFVPASTQYNSWNNKNNGMMMPMTNAVESKKINPSQLYSQQQQQQQLQQQHDIVSQRSSQNHNRSFSKEQQFNTQHPSVSQQKQMLFSQFTQQSNQQNHMQQQSSQQPVEYRVKLQTNEKHEIKPVVVKRSKSPIPSHSRPGSSQSKSIGNLHDRQQPQQYKSPINSLRPPIEKQQYSKIMRGGDQDRMSYNRLPVGQSQQQQQQQQYGNNEQGGAKLSKQNSLRQVTPTKSVSPLKMHLGAQANIVQQRKSENKMLGLSPMQNVRQSNSQQLRSSLGNRTNLSIGDESFTAVPQQIRKQTSSIGYRECTPDKAIVTQSLNFESHIKQKKDRSTQKIQGINSSPYSQMPSNNSIQAQINRSKSPQIRKVPASQMWNKRVESFEQVMSRLTAQQGVSPIKEFTKKPFH